LIDEPISTQVRTAALPIGRGGARTASGGIADTRSMRRTRVLVTAVAGNRTARSIDRPVAFGDRRRETMFSEVE